MPTLRAAALLALAGAILALPITPISAASKPDKKTRTTATTPEVNPWDAPQPAVEKLDLNAYARIREEGLTHSHVMDLASALDDDIGPRLTGSPNMAEGQQLDARPAHPPRPASTRTSKTGASSAWAGSSSTPGCA